MELILPATIWQEVEGSQFHGYPGASWNNVLQCSQRRGMYARRLDTELELFLLGNGGLSAVCMDRVLIYYSVLSL